MGLPPFAAPAEPGDRPAQAAAAHAGRSAAPAGVSGDGAVALSVRGM